MIIWDIDPLHSVAEFSARHLMVSLVKGRFAEVHGSLYLDPKAPENCWIKAQVRTNSIYTGAIRRDAHLRSIDFFDATRYPIITFESTRVFQVRQNRGIVEGNLTIRGITRLVQFSASYTGYILDPDTNIWRIGLSGTSIIDRRNFGMTFNQLIDGIALVGNEIHLDVNLEATYGA